MRVLIADDNRAFRTFLRQILEVELDLSVVGEAADAEEVVRLARQLKPNVVLLDIHLPGPDGVQATRRIELAKRVHKLAQTAREAVVAIDHHGIYLALAARSQHRVQLRALFFRARNAHVHVLTSDLPAAPLAISAELSKLHLGILPGVGADAGVECGVRPALAGDLSDGPHPCAACRRNQSRRSAPRGLNRYRRRPRRSSERSTSFHL